MIVWFNSKKYLIYYTSAYKWQQSKYWNSFTMYRFPTLLETHVFPCKMFQQIPEQDEDLELFLLVCVSNTETRMFRILTGLYHSLVHRDNNGQAERELDRNIIHCAKHEQLREKLKMSKEFTKEESTRDCTQLSIICFYQPT